MTSGRVPPESGSTIKARLTGIKRAKGRATPRFEQDLVSCGCDAVVPPAIRQPRAVNRSDYKRCHSPREGRCKLGEQRHGCARQSVPDIGLNHMEQVSRMITEIGAPSSHSKTPRIVVASISFVAR